MVVITLIWTLANFIKKNWTDKRKEKENTSLEAFLACRIISPDKKRFLYPVGVGEVLQRVVGKVVMKTAKKL